MPLTNRVDPFGAIVATPERGLFMGNRGGRFHRDDRTLNARPWASKQWICCVLAFKGRRRVPMTAGYTELFFVDEVTAFAAGHRPCFECRRADALRFQAAYQNGRRLAAPPRASAMDETLHDDRLSGRAQRRRSALVEDLPDGAMIVRDGSPLAVRGDRLLRWSFAGYLSSSPRGEGACELLTPPSIVAALSAGYAPVWGPSADQNNPSI